MKASAFFDQNYHYVITIHSMNHFQVRLCWKILYCCETCLSAVVCQPNTNTGRVKDTKGLEEICEIKCDSDYCRTKEIYNQLDQ